MRYHVVDYSANWLPEATTAAHAGRIYEVFLPDLTGTAHASIPLSTTLEEPIKYVWIGVSAADDKDYEYDSISSGTWAGRYGQESAVAGPATIFRVRREPPPAPQLPTADSDKVFATRADYHNRSFHTFRWIPEKDEDGNLLPLGYHVFRALDESIFSVDWDRPAEERLTLDPNNNQDHRRFFPSQASEPRWDAQKCQKVADELNLLNTLKSSGIDKTSALTKYGRLSNDALRVLAGLPGNERAFTQLTISPLDPTELAVADRRERDSADTYTPNTLLRAYVDSLDGRASNRYFYRAGSVDGAHNRSKELSLSSPPVCCPDIVPPRQPTLIEAVGGAKNIILRWIENVEIDLDYYLLYRADTAATAKDIRLMKRAWKIARSPTATLRSGEVSPAAVSGAARQLQLDDAVLSNVTYYYRLVAVDTSGNLSEPSRVISGRAYQPPPKPPVWNQPVRMPTINPTRVSLSWTHRYDQGLSCLVERRSVGNGLWTSISGWLPRGQYQFDDIPPELQAAWEYRLRVLDQLRQVASILPMVTLPKS